MKSCILLSASAAALVASASANGVRGTVGDSQIQDYPGNFVGNPLKIQFHDATHFFNATAKTCFTSLAGIAGPSFDQETAAKCPKDSLGHVTPCKPASATELAASGAVIKSTKYGKDQKPSSVSDEASCAKQAASTAFLAGAVWFQDLETTSGAGTAATFIYGNPALTGSMHYANAWGGVQFSWKDVAHTDMTIAVSGGGDRGPQMQVDVYLCKTATYDDDCVLSSYFGQQGSSLNKVQVGTNGAYNVYFVSKPKQNQN